MLRLMEQKESMEEKVNQEVVDDKTKESTDWVC
jgi:hypothetical protein